MSNENSEKSTRQRLIDASRSRRIQILETVIEEGTGSIATLTSRFSCSEAAIRSDLLYLSQLFPQLERIRGGIRYINPFENTYFGSSLRDKTFLEQKQAIAQAVVCGYKEDPPILELYDLVIFGPGTTTFQVCKQMASVGSNYIICTNNLAIPEVAGNLSLFFIGGTFTRDVWATTGKQAEKDFENFLKEHHNQVNKAVLGASGITNTGGVFVHNASETGILSKFIEATPIVVFVASDAKLGKVDTSHLCNLNELAKNEKTVKLITSDIGSSEQKKEELRKFQERLMEDNVKVIIVEE